MDKQNIQTLDVRVSLGEIERTLDYLIIQSLENPFTLSKLKFVEVLVEEYFNRVKALAEAVSALDSSMMVYVVHSEVLIDQKISMLHRNTDKVLVRTGSESLTIGSYDELSELISELSNLAKDTKFTMTKSGERYVDIEFKDAKKKLLKIHGLKDLDYDFDKVAKFIVNRRTSNKYPLDVISYLMMLSEMEPEDIAG